jgi:hypothetical protein
MVAGVNVSTRFCTYTNVASCQDDVDDDDNETMDDGYLNDG